MKTIVPKHLAHVGRRLSYRQPLVRVSHNREAPGFFNGSPHPFAMENPDEWWTDREVGYRFTASGLVLYIVDSRRSRDVEYIDYQAWDND